MAELLATALHSPSESKEQDRRQGCRAPPTEDCRAVLQLAGLAGCLVCCT